MITESPLCGDDAQRQAAVAALAERSDPESRAELIRALADPAWQIRRTAVEALVARGAAETVDAIVQAIESEHRDFGVLNGALQALVEFRADILERLTALLRDPDQDLRISAALALGQSRDARAVLPLLGALRDPNENVVYHAIEALGALRAGAAVDSLAAIAASGDFALAFPAITALGQIRDARVVPQLIPLLDDPLLQQPALEALGRLGGEETVRPVMSILRQGAASPGAVAVVLAEIAARCEARYRDGDAIARAVQSNGGPELVDQFIEAISTSTGKELQALTTVIGWFDGERSERVLVQLLGHPEAREAAVAALVARGSEATDALLAALAADDRETRRAAIVALGEIGDPRAVPRLLAALDDSELAQGAAGALAMTGDARARGPLLERIGHSDGAIRRAVISALNSLNAALEPQSMTTLLENESPIVRESAVKLFGYSGTTGSIELLVDRSRDERELVRRAAIEAIASLEDPRSLPVLIDRLHDESPRVRGAAVMALGHFDVEESRTAIGHALTDGDAWVRYYAVRSASRMSGEELIPALVHLMQRDAAMHVRIAAADALGRTHSVAMLPVLRPLAEASDPDLARAALRALATIPHPETMRLLASVLDSSDPARRLGVVQALAESMRSDAVASLQQTVVADRSSDVRSAAIAGLARMSSADSAHALVALLADPAQRDTVVEVLARLKEEQIPALADGLQHENPDVRRAVVEALARVGSPFALDCLRRALTDSAEGVQFAARQTLSHRRQPHERTPSAGTPGGPQDKDRP